MGFLVQADKQRNRILMTLQGFATLEEVRKFQSDIAKAIAALPTGNGPHQALYDVSEAKVQSQEVVTALRQITRSSPRTSAFALVNASALAGRQLGRIFGGVNVQTFPNFEQALKWLDERRSC